ncbi:MAG: DUF885 domain-containing protein [Deltaproteobacteria bacterium]|nr:DUF885 domain-containing protein [Deltaproteobacteria bacterium]MBW2694052.1 DUF885 domain-containing protein [Deltaproteobacteria bacterium]
MIAKFARMLTAATFVLAIASCGELGNHSRNIEAIADEYLAALLQRRPDIGTYYSIPGARHDRLPDNSLESLAAWQQREDAWLSELDQIGTPAEIGSRDWVTYGILRETLAASIDSRVCRTELWSVSSATGWHTALPSIFEIQPVDTPELQQQAIDRLSALAVYVDTEIRNLREGLEAGYSAPRLNVPAVIEESRALLAEGSPLLSPGVRAEDPAFAARLKEVFDREVVPAVQRYAAFIEDTYLDQARESIAVGGNPNGEQCYPAAVRYFATIAPTAAEIHTLGVEQIAVIRAEMSEIIDAHFLDETIESLMARLNTDPKFTFRTRQAILDYSLAALGAARERMSDAFGRLPKADVEIKPYPAYREGSGTGEYHASSEDGTRPGIYYIAVVNPEGRSIAGQLSVLYHETYPGHHLQGAIALELGDRVHPIARYLYNSGYGEGWGLYSERLADELGLYAGPLDRIGMLSDQAARAARLVVDSGMHTMGWTREQAVDYMLANTAWVPGDIESEIDRYIAWPGQATAYMLGMLEIRRLRDLAEEELGERFDLRAFHDRVLENGSVTLPMLEESIEAWIVANPEDV